ncbi:GTP cyclohydrolase II [Dongia deserti]|uniref:GTP cyclohydrolase II n=1 Tax=Dongia deserti TaxID=2268030 RepID=UPI000E6530D4|nr:GTP cyclohydrolase II [Dongia deserti]
MNSDFQARSATYRATVERCLAELRRGGAIGLTGRGFAGIALAAEMVEEASFANLQSASPDGAPLDSNGGPRLILTASRAADLGLMPPGGAGRALAICKLPAAIGAEAVRQLADPTTETPDTPALGVTLADDLPLKLAEAAIDLAKAARLLPAAIMIALAPDALTNWVDETFVLDCTGLAAHQRALAGSLKRVGSARVPLHGAENTEIIAFRPADGGKEHLAIVIGNPDPAQPVLIRLHSECFTGDLLGSLRCDCGDQLRGAIETIARNKPGAGSGIVLYLAQEGRGIGLINKLRAYNLQDEGADTLEANLQLGFGADERVYQPAAEMLRQLGFTAVRLLTNNPEKMSGLEQCGIRVVERVPHIFPSNEHNTQYLVTKARRFGHMF